MTFMEIWMCVHVYMFINPRKKATEQHLHVVLFIMLYKVVVTFKFVDETLECVTIQMKATE